MFPKRFLSAS